MDAILGRQMGFPMHVDRTPGTPFGSDPASTTLRSANHTLMFTNRIGFGPRFGATLLDILFVILLSTPLTLMGGLAATFISALGLDALASEEDAAAFTMIGIGAGILATAVLIGILAMAYTLIEAFTGASPGKRVMGLQVAREDGSKGDVQLYLVRWALKNSGNLLQFVLPLISTLASLVFFFGCFAALGDKKQALHDIIAKTAVYKKSDITG